jgi:uncharacterized membrane protein YdbT with pleckstrin-like domain
LSYVDDLLAPGETVLHRTRRHWVLLLRWVGGSLVLAALGVAMALLYGFTVADPTSASWGAWAGVALVAVAAFVALPAWLRWANEIYLVTNRRVVQVEGVLSKRTLDSGLAKINDVRLSQSLWARVLGYGTLEILTASESAINRLEYLPAPLAFKKAMMDAAGSVAQPGPRVVEDRAPEPAGHRTAADRLAELEELRRQQLLSEEEYRKKREEILREV